MILLDTNVLSELMRPEPNAAVVAFVNARPRGELYTATIVQAELFAGVALMPAGRRRDAAEALAQRLFDEKFARRVLPFDGRAAKHYPEIISRRRALGRPLEGFDGLIAAVALTAQRWRPATAAISKRAASSSSTPGPPTSETRTTSRPAPTARPHVGSDPFAASTAPAR